MVEAGALGRKSGIWVVFWTCRNSLTEPGFLHYGKKALSKLISEVLIALTSGVLHLTLLYILTRKTLLHPSIPWGGRVLRPSRPEKSVLL